MHDHGLAAPKSPPRKRAGDNCTGPMEGENAIDKQAGLANVALRLEAPEFERERSFQLVETGAFFRRRANDRRVVERSVAEFPADLILNRVRISKVALR